MKAAIELISEKCKSNVEKHGYTAQHDNTHVGGELSQAAACLADVSSAMVRGASADELKFAYVGFDAGVSWPWPKTNEDADTLGEEEYMPIDENVIENLVNAGALIVAEIDRLRRIGFKPVERPDPNQMIMGMDPAVDVKSSSA